MTIKHPCPYCGKEIERDYLLRLYAPIKSKQEMAKLFNVTENTVATWMRDLNILYTYPRANRPNYPELDKMILEGKSNKEIKLSGIPFDKDLFVRRRRALGMQTRRWRCKDE